MGWWRAAVARVRGVWPRWTFAAPTPRPLDAAVIDAALIPAGTAARVSRTEALQVAAVQRARNELCSIATLPLRQYRGTDVIASALLGQIDPDVSNVVTLSQTIEDLVFDGLSWWLVTAQDFAGYPIAARHLAVTSVSLTPPADAGTPAPLPAGHDPRGATVWVDGQPVPASLMIRFDSPNPGLLVACARSIRRALALDDLASTYATNPRPLDFFTESDDPGVEPMTDDQVPTFLARWRSARRLSSTAWVPGNVKRMDVSAPSPAELQLVELQRQVTMEIANGCGVDAEDLGVSTTSRTYFNAVDRRQEKINRSYAPYMAAITQRLSMGDVTRRGQYVGFDLSDYLKSDPVSQAGYWQTLLGMGVTDAAEIRVWAGLPGPPPGVPAPAPAPALAAVPALAFTTPAPHTFVIPGPARLFAADTQARTITGLAVPYGVPSTPGVAGTRYSFAPGSLEWSDVHRVKHLRDHTTPVGKAVRLHDERHGLVAVMDVQPGAAGDELLAAAVHGTYDGFSIGVDFGHGTDDVSYDEDTGTYVVHRATLREVSTVAMPAFDDARHTTVTAAREAPMCLHCQRSHPAGVACQTAAVYSHPYPSAPPPTAQPVPPPPPPPPAPAPVPDDPPRLFAALPPGTTEDQLTQALTALTAAAAPVETAPVRAFVDPTRGPATVVEPPPYRVEFTRRGDVQLHRGSHDFSTDLRAYFTAGDLAAGDRALDFVRHQFVSTGDVNELNPPRQRPDMYVDQREYTYPIWSAVNKGTLTDITPFVFPKFATAAGLVGPHTEGEEPSTGTFTTTSQTVTPTANSGKAELTREVWDQGGNPQISTLIWQQMTRGWFEALEGAAVALLAGAAGITAITLPVADPVGAVTGLQAAMAGLHFVRGGFSMRDGFAQVDLYSALAAATDDAGRPLLPMLGPTNANGIVSDRFGVINVGGADFYPAWALSPSGTTPAHSFLFDRAVVHGWASAPQRLTLDTSEVAKVYIGIWGYQATAISDTSGVRDIVYDPSALAAAAAEPASSGRGRK